MIGQWQLYSRNKCWKCSLLSVPSQGALYIKRLAFIGSSFCSCFHYVFYGICTLISIGLTVFQTYSHSPMELHSVQCVTVTYWLLLIWVCEHSVTCTHRTSLDVLWSHRFSSRFSLKWMHSSLAVPKDKTVSH